MGKRDVKKFTHDFTAIEFGRREHGNLERIDARTYLLINVIGIGR